MPSRFGGGKAVGSLAAKLKRQISRTKFMNHQPPPPRLYATCWGVLGQVIA